MSIFCQLYYVLIWQLLIILVLAAHAALGQPEFHLSDGLFGVQLTEQNCWLQWLAEMPCMGSLKQPCWMASFILLDSVGMSYAKLPQILAELQVNST